jgi:CubicO group peptidase (beta-lactamase class C family)
MADQRFLSARVDGNEAPVSPCSASVPWWSFTKTALATVALQLVAQGHLSLDDLIDSRPYTLRQLLQHRAGVPDYSGLAAYHEAIRQGDKPWGVPELLSRTAADQLEFEPGKGWRYSNVGYLLVRQIIEDVTGQDLGSIFRNLLFDPLKLESVQVAARS